MAKRKITALILAAAFALAAAFPTFAEPAASYPVCAINFDDGSTQGIYPTGSSTYRLDTENYYSAGHSMQILNRTETWNAAEWDLTGKMTAGNTYRFSAYVYHEGDEPATFQFSFKINEGENYTYCRQQVVAPDTWTYVMGKYTVGEDEVSVKPYIELIDNTDAFWVDDISIVQTGGYREDTSIETDITSLKDAFAGTGVTVGTSIGTTVMAGDVTGEQKELIVKHFDSIAIENQLKAQFVLDYDTSVSDLDTYNTSPALDFTAAKPFFEFAKENDLKVTAQALVWFSMTPDWFFYEDYDTSKSFASREIMLQRLENYIKGVLTWCEDNYPGIITSWVVVNEAVNDSIPTPGVRDDNFRKTIGDDYIAKAFEFAHKYRPNDTVRYLYNDYNMEYYWEKVQFALDYLEDCGAIDNGWVDGIGFQCHIRMDWPGTNHIKENAARVAAAGLEAEVTEIDISLRASEVADYASEFDAYYAQRLRYEEVIKAFMDAKAAGLDLKNITWWGLTDGYTWLVSQYNEANFPMLFDANNKAKPAFYGVLDAVGYSTELTNLALNKTTGEVGHQDNHPKELANDGDTSTRWAAPPTLGASSPYTGEYWWWVDLGEATRFNKIVIDWEVCFGKNFVIQVKDSDPDAEEGWTDITEPADGVNGRQAVILEEPVTARYIRMYATEKNTDWGCSMYEFSVYNDPTIVADGEDNKVYIGEDTEDIPLYGGLEEDDPDDDTSSDDTLSDDASSDDVTSDDTSSEDTSSDDVTSDEPSDELSDELSDITSDGSQDAPDENNGGTVDTGVDSPMVWVIVLVVAAAVVVVLLTFTKKKQ